MTDREKGVASVACPTCGNDLVLSDQLDGSISAESCSTCYPSDVVEAKPKTEVASAAEAPRERGTRVSKENADE